MPTRMVIRRAITPDIEWCARLMAANEPWQTLGRNVKATRVQLKRPRAELFIAREGRRRLGFILLDPYGMASSPYICSVAVEERERGRGIGSRLVRFAERRFAGRRHIFLLVSSFNRLAQRLYRRLGYRRVAVLKNYVAKGHSEWLLEKRLRPPRQRLKR